METDWCNHFSGDTSKALYNDVRDKLDKIRRCCAPYYSWFMLWIEWCHCEGLLVPCWEDQSTTNVYVGIVSPLIPHYDNYSGVWMLRRSIGSNGEGAFIYLDVEVHFASSVTLIFIWVDWNDLVSSPAKLLFCIANRYTVDWYPQRLHHLSMQALMTHASFEARQCQP